MKRIIKDYLYFSKQERIAVIVLLLLMGVFIAAPYLYQPKFDPPVVNQALTDWLSANNDSSSREETIASSKPNVERKLFLFDPNTASMEDWVRLGVAERTAKTIINYRNKGGRFRKPGDLKKIWGLPGVDAERLIPYIQLANGSVMKDTVREKAASANVFTKKDPVPIDINTAGVAEWSSLPGIGEVLANRIVRYRDKIGGFRSVQQVARTYGISDSLFNISQPYLHYNSANVIKPNLNTASAYALSQAGLDQRFARDLVRYREQNGPFRSFEELHKLLDMSDSAWQKLLLLVKIE